MWDSFFLGGGGVVSMMEFLTPYLYVRAPLGDFILFVHQLSP